MLNAIRKISLFVTAVVCTVVGLLVAAALFVLGGVYSSMIQTPLRWVNRLMGKTTAKSSLTNGIMNSVIVAVLFSSFALTSPVATGIMLVLIFLNTFESVYDSLTSNIVVVEAIDLEQEQQERKTGATMNDTLTDINETTNNVINGVFGNTDSLTPA